MCNAMFPWNIVFFCSQKGLAEVGSILDVVSGGVPFAHTPAKSVVTLIVCCDQQNTSYEDYMTNLVNKVAMVNI